MELKLELKLMVREICDVGFGSGGCMGKQAINWSVNIVISIPLKGRSQGHVVADSRFNYETTGYFPVIPLRPNLLPAVHSCPSNLSPCDPTAHCLRKRKRKI